MKEKKYIVQTITSINDEFLAQWKELWEHAENATIFNSPEWFEACTQGIEIKEYKILACYEDTNLVAVLPLKKIRHFGCSVLSALSPKFQVDTAFLMEKYDKQLFAYIFNYLIARENVYIQKIDANAAHMLHDIYPQVFFSLMSVNPCIFLTDNLYAHVSDKLLHRIKKVIRKNDGQLHFRLHDVNLQNHLNTMFAIDKKSWKQEHNKKCFSDAKTHLFFTAMTKLCSKFVRIGFLYYKNRPIAYFYGFLYGNTFAAYQTSFLSEYRQFRPGQLALFHLMEQLKGHAEVIDMGGGISRYKQEFTPNYRLLYDLYYSRNGVIMIWWKAINMVRRMKQIILHEKNTNDHKFLFKILSQPQRYTSHTLKFVKEIL